MILTLLPFLLFVLSVSNILYLSVISGLTNWPASTAEVVLLHLICLMVVGLVMKKYYPNFRVKSPSLGWLMITPYLLITLIRLPLVYPTYDDMAVHMMWGDYSNRLWQSSNFMPMNFVHYFYLPLDMNYTPFLYSIGLRLTIWLFYLLTSIWMVSLYLRLTREVKTGIQRIFLTILFMTLPFIPHLLGVSGTLMGDYASLAFCLEALYLFIAKKSDKTFAMIMTLAAVLMKQSNSIFVAPILIYYAVINRKYIEWGKIVIYAITAGLFFVRLYLETGNVLSGLFNGVFQSPLYAPGNFTQTLFGPQNMWQTLVWPVIGQFGERYAEGIVSTTARIFFAPIPILGYMLSIYLMIRRRSLKYGLLVLTYLLWSHLVGYARYYIALNLMTLILLISEGKWSMIKGRWLMWIEKYKIVILGLVFLGSVSSLKTDFSWRPHPTLRTPGVNAYYLGEYKMGLSLVGRDNLSNMAREYKQIFAPYDAVITFYRGPVTYVGYMGYLNGLPVYDGVTSFQYEEIMNGPEVSFSIKEKLRNSLTHQKVIILADKPNDVSIPSLKIYQDFNCEYLGKAFKDPYLQREIYFSETVIYSCIKR